MPDEKRIMEGPAGFFACGGDNCPKDGQPHDWSGPTVVRDEGRTENATCAKCGLACIDWSMMNMP